MHEAVNYHMVVACACEPSTLADDLKVREEVVRGHSALLELAKFVKGNGLFLIQDLKKDVCV